MNGVILKQAQIAHADERRTILPICNGDFTAKQIKIIEVKKGNILGNHCHRYKEIRYMFKGRANYFLEDYYTHEKSNMNMEQGDIMITDPWIVHAAEFIEDSIMIEGTEEAYWSAEKNDIFKNIR